MWFSFFNKILDDIHMTKDSMNPDALNATSREGRTHAEARSMKRDSEVLTPTHGGQMTLQKQTG